jgi:hypothetical protein
LRLDAYNGDAFEAKVNAIRVPEDGVLVFILKDGTERTARWAHRSRRESWTDEMKAMAREKVKGDSGDA